MLIEMHEVGGIERALHAMRSPYQSWERSDSTGDNVGPSDLTLSQSLADRGTEHAKHLRQIVVWATISAPRYWWTQFDTYRYGVEKVSTSTMHTIMRRDFTEDDFENPGFFIKTKAIPYLNAKRKEYLEAESAYEKKVIWDTIIKVLPQSYLQERDVMMSYAAIASMCKQRKGHKLGERAEFIRWAQDLPHFDLTGVKADV